jgi:hypothetical protein
MKSGASESLKSLQQFVLEKGIDQAIRFDLNPPSKMMVNVKALSCPTRLAVKSHFLAG